MIILEINNKEIEVNSLEELKVELKECESLPFAEIWVKGENKNQLCVLLNSKSAFVMFLKDESGLSYISKSPISDSEETEEFELSNGQIDYYSKKNLVSKKVGLNCIKELVRLNVIPENIEWQLG